MNLKNWIVNRSSSKTEKQTALLVAANYLHERVIGNEGESNNTPVAQVASGELVLSGSGTTFTESN